MANKTYAVIGIVTLIAFELAQAAERPVCEPSHADGIWQAVNARSVMDDVRAFSGSSHTEVEARAKLGRPDKVTREVSGQTSMYWTRGAWRESRSDDCKGHVETTYTVAYAIMKLSFKDGQQAGCRVLERSFVSENGRPDPFLETDGLMTSSLRSCKDFLTTQAAK